MVPHAGRALLLVVFNAIASGAVYAGAQRYEPLAASVQAALQSSVADRAAPRLVTDAPEDGRSWLDAMSVRLERHIADEGSRTDFLVSVQYEARRAGLDPQLVLGVIDVESSFRKYAVSSAGARGYMQVMPFWVDLIGSAEHNLFSLRTNLRYGCTILRHYLDVERGDLARALGRYNGSLGKASGYASRVLNRARTRWAWPGGRMREAAAPASNRPLRYMGAVR
jgi:soluble lytic murein transglycosylase-like protein